MTRQRSIVLFLLAAGIIAFGFAGTGVQRLQAQAQAKAAKTSVAVVNVGELINKCQKNLDFQAEMDKRRAKLKMEVEDRQTKINQMRLDLDDIPDAKARADKERKIIEALAEFQAWQQIQQQYLNRDQRVSLIEMYSDIDKTVDAVAKRQGYDIVLFDTPFIDFDQLNTDQLFNAIGNRRVIYRSEEVNISRMVLDQLNLDYQTRGN